MEKIIIFGESIWDLFEDGSKRLGGSGLNVAWHLYGLGVASEYISRVGNDRNGIDILELVREWGLSTKLIQMDADHPTAYLQVIVDEKGGHKFPSPPEHALDHITFKPSWLDFPVQSLMYHGTYMLRHEVTRNSVAAMKKRGLKVFMDINLRENYWSQELLTHWIRGVGYLKLSDQELKLWQPGLQTDFDGEVEFLQSYMKTNRIEHVLYTLGPQGSVVLKGHDVVMQRPTGEIKINNTVGAGDAYCAGFMYGIMKGHALDMCALWGTKLAEKICTIDSATSHQKSFYQDLIKEMQA
ncbi:MAG: hypothetical protein KDD46_05985 [Bdellovibrionales bacterium]|nr:hypothetical protein [Bdellovibrionales bacterium]